MIAERFGATLESAARCEHYAWRTTPEGRLAEVIMFDQFSRNIFRNSASAFAPDPLALAQELVAPGVDMQLPIEQRKFAYMPYMHSESVAVHQEALRLFAQPGLEGNLEFERRHLAIIERFGRYPHRNAVPGRESTGEELAFLLEPDARF